MYEPITQKVIPEHQTKRLCFEGTLPCVHQILVGSQNHVSRNHVDLQSFCLTHYCVVFGDPYSSCVAF